MAVGGWSRWIGLTKEILPKETPDVHEALARAARGMLGGRWGLLQLEASLVGYLVCLIRNTTNDRPFSTGM
jgi:hypothetical protein